jgi:hypothetical protein
MINSATKTDSGVRIFELDLRKIGLASDGYPFTAIRALRSVYGLEHLLHVRVSKVLSCCGTLILFFFLSEKRFLIDPSD